MPRGGEAGDAATDDHERNVGPRILRDFDAEAITQTMTEDVRRADDLTRRQRRRFAPPASSERHRKPKESC